MKFMKLGSKSDTFQSDGNNIRYVATELASDVIVNLVSALENGLSDVDSHGACSRVASSKNSDGASKGRGGRGKGSSSRSGAAVGVIGGTNWSCEQCTYSNVRSATTCQMYHSWFAVAVSDAVA